LVGIGRGEAEIPLSGIRVRPGEPKKSKFGLLNGLSRLQDCVTSLPLRTYLKTELRNLFFEKLRGRVVPSIDWFHFMGSRMPFHPSRATFTRALDKLRPFLLVLSRTSCMSLMFRKALAYLWGMVYPNSACIFRIKSFFAGIGLDYLKIFL